MMPCHCTPRQRPSPICCCSWPPKAHQCYCRGNPSLTSLMTCQNFARDCPCSTYLCRPCQPPLRTMQRALVDKWTEIEKLGQIAHMYWCQHRTLQHQLATMRAKYCRLLKQGFSDMEDTDKFMAGRCTQDNPSVYQGVLKIKERDNNQLCICNKPEAMTTYRGAVRVHDQDEAQEVSCVPASCNNDYAREAEKLQTECEMKEINSRMVKVGRSEEEVHGRLQRLREELASLQTKIKSNWGQNALDKCTPAKENQTRFF